MTVKKTATPTSSFKLLTNTTGVPPPIGPTGLRPLAAARKSKQKQKKSYGRKQLHDLKVI